MAKKKTPTKPDTKTCRPLFEIACVSQMRSSKSFYEDKDDLLDLDATLNIQVATKKNKWMCQISRRVIQAVFDDINKRYAGKFQIEF